jgi:hypothetical protein
LLFDSRALGKHVGVSAQFEVLLDLAHVPLEFSIEIFNIFCNQLCEDTADFLELVLMLSKIELEGTV